MGTATPTIEERHVPPAVPADDTAVEKPGEKTVSIERKASLGLEEVAWRYGRVFEIIGDTRLHIEEALAAADAEEDGLRKEKFREVFWRKFRDHPVWGSLFRDPARFAALTDAIENPLISDENLHTLETSAEKAIDGGFGKVLLDEKLGTAIKFLDCRGGDREKCIGRFEREQRITKSLLETGVVPEFYGGGVTPDGRRFFVMEFIRSRTLEEVIGDNLSLHDRYALIAELHRAVKIMHSKGIVHRDLKPRNIMVQKQSGHWQVKIIDFGLAKPMDGGDPNMTRDVQLTTAIQDDERGPIMGSALYLSPGQAKNAALVAFENDLYSLGLIADEILKGRATRGRITTEQEAFAFVNRMLQDDFEEEFSDDGMDPQAANAIESMMGRRGEMDIPKIFETLEAGGPVKRVMLRTRRKAGRVARNAAKGAKKHPWITAMLAVGAGFGIGGAMVYSNRPDVPKNGNGREAPIPPKPSAIVTRRVDAPHPKHSSWGFIEYADGSKDIVAMMPGEMSSEPLVFKRGANLWRRNKDGSRTWVGMISAVALDEWYSFNKKVRVEQYKTNSVLLKYTEQEIDGRKIALADSDFGWVTIGSDDDTYPYCGFDATSFLDNFAHKRSIGKHSLRFRIPIVRKFYDSLDLNNIEAESIDNGEVFKRVQRPTSADFYKDMFIIEQGLARDVHLKKWRKENDESKFLSLPKNISQLPQNMHHSIVGRLSMQVLPYTREQMMAALSSRDPAGKYGRRS